MNFDKDKEPIIDIEQDDDFAQFDTKEEPRDSDVIENLFENIDTSESEKVEGFDLDVTNSSINTISSTSAKLYVNTFDTLLKRIAHGIAGTGELQSYGLSDDEKEEYEQLSTAYFQATGKEFAPSMLFPIATLAIASSSIYTGIQARLNKKKIAKSQNENQILKNEIANLKNAIVEQSTRQLVQETPVFIEDENINISNLVAPDDDNNSINTKDIEELEAKSLVLEDAHNVEPAENEKKTDWGSGVTQPFASELIRTRFFTDSKGFYTCDVEGNKVNAEHRTEKMSEYVRDIKREKGVSLKVLIKRKTQKND